MITIHKYPLLPVGGQCVHMPAGAKILSVNYQREQICVWALVDTDKPVEGRWILVLGTGHDASELTLGAFIGAVLINDGALVFHVFEEG